MKKALALAARFRRGADERHYRSRRADVHVGNHAETA